MLSAVSPAVVLPVMIKLQKKGIGSSNGIPTMVIAVAGIDDVLAVTGFEIVLGLIFATGVFPVSLTLRENLNIELQNVQFLTIFN